MRSWMILVCSSLGLCACGATSSNSRAASDAVDTSKPDPSAEGASGKRSPMSDWSEVPSNESKPAAVAKRNSQVVVDSDPKKHGQALHFHFVVNSVPISGVFSAPGGQTSTFTIPAGVVQFTVDECEGDEQGFELSPEQAMPLKCELTTDGDCCEVVTPAESKSKR